MNIEPSTISDTPLKKKMKPKNEEFLKGDLVGGWFQPKNMLVKWGSSSPIFGVKMPKMFELPPPTRWAPTSYKRSYNPYKWPYKWVTEVITPISGVIVITLLITGGGPSCRDESCLPRIGDIVVPSDGSTKCCEW